MLEIRRITPTLDLAIVVKSNDNCSVCRKALVMNEIVAVGQDGNSCACWRCLQKVIIDRIAQNSKSAILI